MLVGIDNEYIPEDARMGNTPGPRPDVTKTYCEVMQMGACKLDADEVAVMNQAVSAHRLHVIPQWLSSMTGMTAERREREGIPFPEAYEQLVDFVGDEAPWVFKGDEHVLRGNVAAHGLEWRFPEPFRLVSPLLHAFRITRKDYELHGFNEVNSGNLHHVLGINLPAISGVGAHDALHDASSLIHSVHYLLTTDVKIGVTIEITDDLPHFAGRPKFQIAVRGLRVKARQDEWEDGATVEGSRICYSVWGKDLHRAIMLSGNIHRISLQELPIHLALRPSHCTVIA